MTDLLQKLCSLNGAAGAEDEVREYIKAETAKMPGIADIKTDARGNLLIEKKGRRTPACRLMLAAHMDEVAFMVTHICGDGFIKFDTVGGITPSAVIGRTVYFPKCNLRGVIGGTPVHLLKDTEKDEQPKTDRLYADINAADRKTAEQYISPGDVFYYSSEFFPFGDGFVKGKAIDDRAGIAIMLALLKDELEYDTFFAFTTGEEVGTRGAAAAVWNLRPDVCIVLEATTACDTPENSGGAEICKCGGGAVVSYMDKGTVYDKTLYRAAFGMATELGLPVQTKTRIAGGNDARAIHTAFGGVRTLAVSVPCRYLHTPSCVIKTDDLTNTAALVRGLAEIFAGNISTTV